MKKIILTADSTFDMPFEKAGALDIKVIPSYVSTDGDNVADYPDITAKELFEYHDRSGKLPRTSAASPWDYTQFFTSLMSEDVEIIHIAKSSGMSCCVSNALMAAKEVKGVTVFDSMSISGGSAMMAEDAARMRDEGRSAGEIISALEKLRNDIKGAFIVDNLTYLHEGGRCSSLSRLGANLLKLRPQIVIKDGSMSVGKKYRGKFETCVYEFIDDMISGLSKDSYARVCVCHTLTQKALLDKALGYIREHMPLADISVCEAGPAVSCHCGPDTFGIFVIKE